MTPLPFAPRLCLSMIVRNEAADPGGSRGGYLRELTFTVNGDTRTESGTGANSWNGWG